MMKSRMFFHALSSAMRWSRSPLAADNGCRWHQFRQAVVIVLIGSIVATVGTKAEDASVAVREANSLDQKAIELFDRGKYSEALPLAERALAISEKALGPEHPNLGGLLNNLALTYQYTGDYSKAEPLYRRVLAIVEKTIGPDDPNAAAVLDNLAQLYRLMGNSDKAEPFARRALAIREKVFGPEHPKTAISLNSLALLYDSMGDHPKAEPLLLRAVAISEKALGPDHPDTATCFNNLALHYKSMGDYAKAEPIYLHALTIKEKALGPEHPSAAKGLNNLAELYKLMGDYEKAESLYQRALTIFEKALGPEHPDAASTLDNLAYIYTLTSNYTKAVPLAERALAIFEKRLGSEHPDTAVSLNNLALLYYSLGDYARAEPLLRRALEIKEKALGPEHPSTAISLVNLAEVYQSMSDYAKAEPLYKRALPINEKLGPEHPETAITLSNLASLYYLTGDQIQAHSYGLRAITIEQSNLARILSFASEAQRLTYQREYLSFALVVATGTNSEIAQTVLRWKGVVLDSVLEDRAVLRQAGVQGLKEQLDTMQRLKGQLMKLTLETPKDLRFEAVEERRKSREQLEQQLTTLEGTMARQVTARGRTRDALSVTVDQAKAALPPKQALIEYVRYTKLFKSNQRENRYGAVVVAAASEPQWVDLGKAMEIERIIALYQKSARGKTDEATLAKNLQSLYALLLAPIEKVLPAGTATLIVSPDGALSFVSFATLLMADNRFVGERYSVRYVSSGRDLLRTMPKPTDTRFAFFGSPDFRADGPPPAGNIATPATLSLRAAERGDLQALVFQPLPGTERECKLLEQRAKAGRYQTELRLGTEATEQALAATKAPRVLHLATHGFFLPEADLGETKPQLMRFGAGFGENDLMPKGKLLNPMHRSGVALAGAQRTIEAWGRGEVPPPQNDGILTAEEVAGLNLEGTWLVTLSACETGSGEARAGEGVLGLRRAFVQAGAQHLMMTLWPISDETTVEIINQFYTAAFTCGHPGKAMAAVQTAWLTKLRKEKGLLYAVNRAGPFIVTSLGPAEPAMPATPAK